MMRRLFGTAAASMGKKNAKKPGKTEPTTITPSSTPSTPSPLSFKDGEVLISVHLKPGAKTTQVNSVNQDCVDISVSAPPVEGEANAHLLRFLADTLGAKKSAVRLKAGHKSRDKVVAVSGVDLDSIQEKLKTEAH